MAISSYYKDIIYSKSFKGYSYNPDLGKIVANRSLSSDEFESIVSQYDSFGFASRDEACDELAMVLTTGSFGQYVNTVSLKDIQVGMQICLEQSFQYNLDLLYIGDFYFIIVSDDSHRLQSGDRLLLLDNGFRIGNSAIFKVLRDGVQYPDSFHFYETDNVERIAYTPVSHDSQMKVSKELLTQKKKAITLINAWKIEKDDCGSVWVNQDQLTEDSRALFQINLSKLQIKCNIGYDRVYYHQILKVNITKDLLEPVYGTTLDIKDSSSLNNLCASITLENRDGHLICFVKNELHS